MTNEEILKVAQNNRDKEGEGEAEIYHYRRAVLIGNLVWIAFCVISIVVKAINKKYDNIEMVYVFLLNGTIQLYLAKQFHNKKKLLRGIIEVVVAIAFFVLFLEVMFS